MKNKQSARAAGRSNLLPLILIGAGVLLIVAVLIWQALNQPAANTTNNTANDSPYPDVERVSLPDAKTAFDQQSAIFLDVRDPGSYEAGHIPGAINIPLAQLENRLSELDANQWIITYCT